MVYKRDVVARVAYIIGMKKEVFSIRYADKDNVWDELESIEGVKIIHELSRIRQTLLDRRADILRDKSLKLVNILNDEDYFDKEQIAWVMDRVENLYIANGEVDKYIAHISDIICQRGPVIKQIFEPWVPVEEIQKLFKMNTNDVRGNIKEYIRNRNKYPYQLYINFYGMENMNHNLLVNDNFFIEKLCKRAGIHIHKLYTYVCEADNGSGEESQEFDIHNFINEHDNILVVVDCENMGPDEGIAVLSDIIDEEPIKEVALIEDERMTCHWSNINMLLDKPVTEIMTKRLIDTKSNVDMQLALTVCRKCIENKIDGVILLSSDCDYMCLIDELSNIDFCVVYNPSIMASAYYNALKERGIKPISVTGFEAVTFEDKYKGIVEEEVVRVLNSAYDVKIDNLITQSENIKKLIETLGAEVLNREYLSNIGVEVKGERLNFYL